MDALVAHQRAQDVFTGVLLGVTPDRMDEPTPCSEWNVADLIEHVVGGNEGAARAVGADAPAADRPADLNDAHRVAAAAAQQAFSRPEAMTALVEMPFGQIPGSVYLGMRSTDVFTHAWDLAAATGQSTDLDPELADFFLITARERVQPQFRGPGLPFAAEVACPADRPAADQLAAFLGRDLP